MTRRTPALPGFDSDYDGTIDTCFTARIAKERAPVVKVEPVTPPVEPIPEAVRGPPERTSGDKAKAKDILAAIKTLKRVEGEQRPATEAEREVMKRFTGFGGVALGVFPDPVTGKYKDHAWQVLGEELQSLLTAEEYASAKRTTFCAFYTAPVVMDAMHEALKRLGVPEGATVLEPGCGVGNFVRPGFRFIGVELDSISGRLAKAIHPDAEIRIEDFQRTKLPALGGVIGNVPFADIKLTHNGQKFSLHDYFFAKSLDSLKPGGVLALVTSHFTLDKQNASIREYIGDRADFLGAIRLPSDAFKKEGTAVVTDIVFLRKRALDEPPRHVDPDWLHVDPTEIGESTVPFNRYFKNHPEQVLGTLSSKDTLYGEGYSVRGTGELAEELKQAVNRLPVGQVQDKFNSPTRLNLSPTQPAEFVPPPPERHISEGSFFVHQGRIHQLVDGQSVPVVYGGTELSVYKGLVGKRMAALIDLRDKARYVLRSQNEGWPEQAKNEARRKLNQAYDSFRHQYGPINKTTITETKNEGQIRRMPNVVKFREDPDAMLVMALEEYDEETGEAKKAAIMSRDVVGKSPPITKVESAEQGLLVSLDQKGRVDLDFIAELYGKTVPEVDNELGDLIYHDPKTGEPLTADEYLSGNVRQKLKEAIEADIPAYIEALKAVQPEDILPGDIDANLGAPWIPASDVRQFAADLFKVEPSSITIAHMAKEAAWSVEGDYHAERAVPVTTDYGTSRASGLWLFELALNLKSPTIYDPAPGDPDKRVVNQEATMAAKEKQKLIKEKFREWVFSDPDRTERLVRLYNDNFNNLRPRHFDGSHLDFPGMSQAITLRPHQRDAVWRGMSGGNTLLAHSVGAGKSLVLASTAMKLKQTGLAKKSVVVVPNHLLEQFAREFQQGYPNAKILVAGKDDFTKERRKFLTAKIASGDWDAIIVTHSSFERIGMSRNYQEKFLREQIAEFDALLCDNAGSNNSKARRNLLKQIEKQKAAREEKLKELLAEEKKDTGLVFDELGVDHLMVDECFTYDTLIDTDRGPLKIGDIVTNRLLVSLRTWNAQTGVIEMKPVVNWFPNKRRGRLVEVVHEFGSFICTPSHKIWIDEHGYKAAERLEGNESLLVLPARVYDPMHASDGMSRLSACQADANGAVRTLSEDVRVRLAGTDARQPGAPQVLHESLQSDSPTSQPRNRGQVQGGNASLLGQLAMQGTLEPRRLSVDESEQIYLPAGDRPEDIPSVAAKKEPPCPACARRQREEATASTVPSGGDYRPAYGVCNQDSGHPGADGSASSLLQSGSCRSSTQPGCGGGWIHPLLCEGEGARCEEGQGLVASRVVSVTLLEPGSDGEYRFGGRTHQVVYDIEVADNHNYFANGVLVSNCQQFKNLETATKMDRVAGIQTSGSERAFDLFMKSKYLHEQHAGHGLTFASGTPISNSMVEMYTMQRYLDPDGLKSRGIEHFDAWAASFGEVVEAMEISPDGKSLRPRSRFAKFVNLPELQQMFRAFADVQTAEMLNLPRPALKGGKPETVACPMSDEQKEIQDKLVERYERIRNGGVDPRDDNALAITTDGRKLALDARMVSPEAHDFPGSKINALVENIVAIHRLHLPTKGTQMVFCDMGVNPTPWGFSAYDEITRKLVDRGIPREQIAAIGEADSDSKKAALFEKVRNGSVRVLIGSTAKLGTGTNVQKRLVALHHLDAPWKPAECEQRDGRILRQGNDNPEVSIYRYVTQGSFDSYMWQALETKARFINQVMTGQSGVRRSEDVGGQELSYAEVKAIASGNPAVLTLAEADAELQRLAVLRRNHADVQFLARRNLRELPSAIERLEKRIAGLSADMATIKGKDELTIGGKLANETALAKALNMVPDEVDRPKQYRLGQFRGLTFGIERFPGGADVCLEGQAHRTTPLHRDSQGPRAVMNALNRIADSYAEQVEATKKDLDLAKSQLSDFEARLDKPFPHKDYLEELAACRDKLKVALSDRTPAPEEEPGPTAADLAEQIKALMGRHKVEDAPRVRAEKVEPIRRRMEKPRPVPENEKAPESVKEPEPPEPVAPEPVEQVEEEPPVTFRHRVVSRSGQMSLF